MARESVKIEKVYMCYFEKKYKNASLELRANGLEITPFIKILRFLGLRVKPLYYNEIYKNLFIVYSFWFCLVMVLSFFSNKLDYIFLSIFPAFVSLVFSFYYHYKFKILRLTPWREL
ncbi:hypothetical protein HC723_15350 [Vibrio sp. S11_S32]|uniref:DUF6404 family protein n=1 Tax=Vibrio sp. S11_S32 TaxID=2720225 RepID=UPI0016810C0F|nr:DUF6404 family protein [Vibrio sp. S11_S32]MBD1577777.1 hypothetical protein [Vibrio sp. S11_S32]